MASRLEEIKKKMRASQPEAVSVERTSASQGSTGGSRVRDIKRKMVADVDGKYIQSFLNDARDHVTNTQREYEGLTWQNARSEEVNVSRANASAYMNQRARKVRTYLDAYKEDIPEEQYTALKQYLDGFDAFQNQSAASFRNAYAQFSQFETEDDYNSAVAAQEEYEKMEGEDISVLEQEIADLTAQYESLDWTDASQRERMREYEATIAEKSAYLNRVKRLHEGDKMSGVANPESEYYDPDFERKSQYISTVKVGRIGTPMFGDEIYEYINNPTVQYNMLLDGEVESTARNLIDASHTAYNWDNPFDDGESFHSEANYAYMRKDEVAIYNYYYATGGKEAAQKYLDNIQETLNHRKAVETYGNLKDKPVLELVFGVEAGLDQFASGINNLFKLNDSYIPSTDTQITSGMVREDLADTGPKLPDWLGGASLGQAGYDTVTTTANMLPSVLASTATGIVDPTLGQITGAALMGGSAAGNAYQEMVNLGYSPKQARKYAVLVGGSEAGLQYLLGGIGKLGGKLTSNAVANIINGIDNAFARIAIKLGGNMISEGMEEGLQEILTPWFKKMSLHIEEDVNWEEVAYSSLLGSLTAFFMEGGSTINGEVQNYKTGKKLQASGISAQRLAELGKTFSADTVAYQLAGRVNENTGAYTMGRLFNEIGATLTEQNVNDITQALIEKGMDRSTARKNAKALALVVEGGDLSDLQVAAIEFNDALAEAVKTTIIDPNATWFQRSQGYNEALMAIAQEKVSKNVSETDPAQQSKDNGPTVDNVASENENGLEDISEADVDTADITDAPAENASESRYEVSTDGQTIQKSTGETVSLQRIASVKDGKLTFQTEDGAEVDADDVSFATEDEALVYEAVAQLEGIVDAEAADGLAKHLLKLGEPMSDTFVRGIVQAYQYGYSRHSREATLGEDTLSALLTERQRNVAYGRGEKYRQAVDQASSRKQTTVTTADHKKTAALGNTKTTPSSTSERKGGIYDAYSDKKLDTTKLTSQQRVGVSFAHRMSKKFGMTFYFYRSYMKDGVRVYKNRNGEIVKAENGFYDPSDRSIHVDLNAGSYGRGTVLFTISHELVHFMNDTSPQHFEKLANLLMEGYAHQGQSVEDLIALQQAEAQENGRTLAPEEAYEEVIADSMEEILADGRVMELIQKLEAGDRSLAAKVKKFFHDIAQLLKETIDAYRHYAPDSREGNMVREMRDIYSQLQEAFAEGIYEGGKKHGRMEINKNVGNVKYSAGYGAIREALAKKGLDKMSQKYGDRFPLSASFDSVMRADNTPLKMQTVKANQIVYGKGIGIFKAGRNAFIKTYGHKTAVHIQQMGIDAMLYADMAKESISKAVGQPNEQSTLDVIPKIKEIISDSILFGVERIAHTGNKGTVLYGYRLYNLYWYQNGNKKSPNCLVCTVVQSTDAAEGYVFHNIENVTVSQGLPDNSAGVSPSANGNIYTIAQLYKTVKRIDREKGGLKYSQKDREKYLFPYTESNDGKKFSTRRGETTSYTPRFLLTNADESIAKTPAQKEVLQKYREIASQLKAQELLLADAEKRLQPIVDSRKVEDRRQRIELRDQILVTKNRIGILQDQLKRYEGYDTVRDMVTRERKRVVQEQLATYREQYGTLDSGENRVRDDALPKSTDGKNKVSLTARTVKGAGITTDEFADLIDEQVAEGKLTYLPISNNATTKKAREEIERDGWKKSLEDWSHDVRNGKVSAKLTAKGAILLNNAAQAGDRDTWLDILHDYQHMGTSAGQAIQALRILKQLAPEDKLHVIKRSIGQLIQDTGIKFSVDDIVSKIDPEILEMYKKAETYEEEEQALQEIGATIAEYVPATFMDKWTALRYLNMLGNVRTQVRNIAGNTAMSMVTTLKNTTSMGIEQLAYHVSGGKFQRTKAFAPPAMVKAAAEDFKIIKSVVLGGGKFSDSSWASSELAQVVRDNQRIFKNKFMEKYRNITNWAMDKGDLIFSRTAYANALAGYLRAKGIKDSDFSKVDSALMDAARIYAVKEAQEATFRDTNTLSGWISKVGRRNDTPGPVKAISEGVMPFRKTPANILIRAEEYSPLGFVNSLYLMVQKATSTTKLTGKGNVLGSFARGGETITGADIVNSLAKGLTGTGLFFLGMWLSGIGMLIGGADEDEELDYFQSLNGQQNYALKIGDVYLTIDFLSPAAIPMFVGAQLQKLSGDGGIELKDWEAALTSLADPLIQMSMLQGVSSTLDNIRFSDNNTFQLVISAAANYLTQGLTNSLLGQTERSFEKSRQTTYVDGNSALPSWMQRTLGKASAKIPFWDYHQIPYINAWGEEEENPSVPVNMAYNMLSPSYVSTETVDSVSQELTRLNEVQDDENVFPSTPSRKYNNEPLSAEQYVALAKSQGQTQRKLVESMVESQLYAKLPDTYKAKAISSAYTYAKESAQIEILGRDTFSSKWMAEIEGDAAKGILDHIISENIDGMYLSGDISANEAVKLRMEYHGDTKEKAQVTVTGWSVQLNKEVYEKYLDEIGGIESDKDKDGKTIPGSRKKKVIAVIHGMDITKEQKDALYLKNGWTKEGLKDTPWH